MRDIRDRIVVEIDGKPPAEQYRWIEVSLDDPIARVAATVDRCAASACATSIVGASKIASWRETVQQVTLGIAVGLDAVVFEAPAGEDVSGLVAAMRASGCAAIPTIHLGRRCQDVGLLTAELERLDAYGGLCPKLAYDAYTADEVQAGLDALRIMKGRGCAASLTPIGTAWGRIAAAVRGSELVFAPLESADPTRPSAQALIKAVLSSLARSPVESAPA